MQEFKIHIQQNILYKECNSGRKQLVHYTSRLNNNVQKTLQKSNKDF